MLFKDYGGSDPVALLKVATDTTTTPHSTTASASAVVSTINTPKSVYKERTITGTYLGRSVKQVMNEFKHLILFNL